MHLVPWSSTCFSIVGIVKKCAFFVVLFEVLVPKWSNPQNYSRNHSTVLFQRGYTQKTIQINLNDERTSALLIYTFLNFEILSQKILERYLMQLLPNIWNLNHSKYHKALLSYAFFYHWKFWLCKFERNSLSIKAVSFNIWERNLYWFYNTELFILWIKSLVYSSKFW